METEQEPGPAGPRINLAAFVTKALLRFHLLVILAAGVGLAVGLFRAVISPNQYQSRGKLFVRSGIYENLSVESAISGTGAPSGMQVVGSREAIYNELQVLSAPELYDKVVALVGADELLAPYDPGQGDPAGESWSTRLFHGFQSWWFSSDSVTLPGGGTREYRAAQLLQGSVLIDPDSGASVINVAHSADSPEKAKRVVDAVLQAAIELHAEVFSTSSSLASVEAELIKAEDAAREAEGRLRDYRLKREIYDFEAQREGLIGYLVDLGRQCDATDLEVQRQLAEHEKLTKILAGVPEKRPIDGQITINPEFTRLTTFLGQLQVEKLQLDLGSLRGGDASVYEKQSKIVDLMLTETKTALSQEKPTIEPPLIDHPRRERIVQLIDEVDVALDGLKKQREQLDKARIAMKSRLAEFDAMSVMLKELELDAAQKRTTSDRLAEGVNNLKAVQRLDQLNLSNVRVMQWGSLELDKVAPRRGKLLAYGAVGGAFFGLLLAVALAFLDRSVRDGIGLMRAGVPAEAVVLSAAGDEPAFAEGSADVARLWAMVPYDQRGTGGLKLAVLTTGVGADAARVAADLAIGLARHGGERVVLVSCVGGPTTFESRSGVPSAPGWREVLHQDLSLNAALQSTPVPGLRYLPAGQLAEGQQHLTAQRGLFELLDRLCTENRFVVVQLASVDEEPESLGLLRSCEAALIVARAKEARRDQVEDVLTTMRASEVPLVAAVLQSERAR